MFVPESSRLVGRSVGRSSDRLACVTNERDENLKTYRYLGRVDSRETKGVVCMQAHVHLKIMCIKPFMNMPFILPECVCYLRVSSHHQEASVW